MPVETATLDTLWPAGKTARHLEMSRQALDQNVRAGRIGFVPSPLGRLFSPDEVVRFKEERERRQRKAERST